MMNIWSFGAMKEFFSRKNEENAESTGNTVSVQLIDNGHDDEFAANTIKNMKGTQSMINEENNYECYDLVNLVPHCPVVMVLDTSHSMWGKGLSDLKQSLAEFSRIMCQETFQDAMIDVETIRMGENFGVLEAFTPVQNSVLTGMEIRPKGDTPLGASLELALSELEKQMNVYRANGTNYVQPQMVVLSDGKSSDDFSHPAQEIRERVREGKLVCRAIALGSDPDYDALRLFAGDAVVASAGATMKESFRTVGRAVSQEYEEKVEETIVNEFKTASASAPRTGRMFLLDGTNILYWNQRNGISLDCVKAITTYLKAKGEDYMVIFDASTPYVLKKKQPAEHSEYESLLKRDPEHFTQVPAGTCADVFLLEEAKTNPEAVILTQDLFRDHKYEYPEVLNQRDRIASGMFLNGKVVFPSLKFSIPMNRSAASAGSASVGAPYYGC